MTEKTIKILHFRLLEKDFAFWVDDVVRVIDIVEITRIPDAPKGILGIINLHGELIAVGDIKRRFGIKPDKISLSNKIIITKIDQRKLAFIVDEVIDYLEIESTDYTAGKDIWPGLISLQGVIKLNSDIILISDLKLFLNGKEWKILDDVIRKVK